MPINRILNDDLLLPSELAKAKSLFELFLQYLTRNGSWHNFYRGVSVSVIGQELVIFVGPQILTNIEIKQKYPKHSKKSFEPRS